MIDDLKVGFKIGIVDLLKEDIEFAFNLLGFVEEIKLVLFFLSEDSIDKLLKLFGTSLDWKLIDSKGTISVIDEIDNNIFGYLDYSLRVFFYFFFSKSAFHYQQLRL